jgi:hypothetical protein
VTKLFTQLLQRGGLAADSRSQVINALSKPPILMKETMLQIKSQTTKARTQRTMNGIMGAAGGSVAGREVSDIRRPPTQACESRGRRAIDGSQGRSADQQSRARC